MKLNTNITNRFFAPRLGSCWLLAAVFVWLAPSLVAQSKDSLPDFSSLTLQELGGVKVTSVSKTDQMLSQVAAAVYVISQEEIHRSGMTNVADLLRLVPGLSVARLDGSKWAVTSRGFNGRFANKLLVLIDGRSVYTPTFSGVYWDMCFPLLDDIDRIEVIRGPGASVWGANAVNGVINIITQKAGETTGVSVAAGGGTAERAFGQIRFGGKDSEGISYRGYFSGSDRSALQTMAGQNARDGWSDEQGGFRIDGTNRNGGWQLEGDLYRNQRNDVSYLLTPAPILNYGDFSGASSDLTFEWRRRVTEKSDLRITAYYDFINRPEQYIPTEQTRTGDFEAQYHFTSGRHEVTVGLADRLISETVIATFPLTFHPEQVTYQLASGFAQDEIHLWDDRLLFTLGVKIEHSVFGGWLPQPSVRALWAPNKRHSAWISISRAARTPSFYETDIIAQTGPPSIGPLGIPVSVTLNGTPQLQAENLNSYEIGYRAQLSPRFSIDVTAFYDDYDRQSTENAAMPVLVGGAQPYMVVPLVFANYGEASGLGGEIAATYQPFSRWKVAGSYGYLNLHQSVADGSPPGTSLYAANAAPNNQWKVQSYLNVSKAVQFDCFLFSSSSIVAPDAVAQLYPYRLIPPHTRMDVRLGWRVTSKFEVSVSGQDLLSPRHIELTPEALSPPTDAVRGYYLKTQWRF